MYSCSVASPLRLRLVSCSTSALHMHRQDKARRKTIRWGQAVFEGRVSCVRLMM